MKTAPMMVKVLPRFRFFVWGFGLCALILNATDGYFSPAVLIFLLLGAGTYPIELSNQRLIQNAKRLEAFAAKEAA